MILRRKIDIPDSVSIETTLQECKQLDKDLQKWIHVIVEVILPDSSPKLMTDIKPRSKKLKNQQAGKML